MTGGLKDQIVGSLSDAINPQQLLDDVNQAVQNGDPEVGAPTNPRVPMCAAEAIVAKVIALNKDEIDDSNNAIVNNLNAYLEDTNEMLAGITGFASEITNQIGDIVGSMTGALDFTNFQINIFGCELEPTVAESDTYTFCSGGDQTAPPQKPSSKSIEDGIESATEISDAPKTTPYLEPGRSQRPVVELDQNTQAILAEENDPGVSVDLDPGDPDEDVSDALDF
tara:strand:- start:50 stop:721 length:672 start_codon:yes stop_codon:yes gene_type:complete